MLLSALAVLCAGLTLAGDLVLASADAGWRATLRLVVVLRDPGPRPEAVDGIVGRARALRGVASVRYVSPDVALTELRQLLGARGDGLDRLPSNPLPPRLEVAPAAMLDAAGLATLGAALDRLPGVSEVQGTWGWVEPLERVRRGVRLGGVALAAGLGLATLAAAAGTTVAARRAGAEEVSVLRLVGVPEHRLVMPLILHALGLAGLGALLGLGLLLLASEPGAPWTEAWLRSVLGLDPLPLLPSRWLAGLAGGGTALGLVGALAAGRA